MTRAAASHNSTAKSAISAGSRSGGQGGANGVKCRSVFGLRGVCSNECRSTGGGGSTRRRSELIH